MNKRPCHLLVVIAGLLTVALFSGCSSRGPVPDQVETETDFPPPEPRDMSGITDAVPRAEPHSRYGNPPSYTVYGKRYYTMPSSQGYKERGIASWYGGKFHGRRTSSGEIYDLYEMTAAHKTLPLPTYARVTNLRNGRSITVKINDRGPFLHDRLIDLSYVAAAKLGILEYGTGLVEVEAIDPAAPEPQSVAAARPVPVNGASSLFLQVGAFGNKENAERLREQLEASDLGTISIAEGATASGPLYRVRIGPLQSADEAERIAGNLISQGISNSRVIID